MSRLDEKTIIKIFQNKLSKKKFVSDDVEVFKIGKQSIVVKVDTLVESTDIPKKVKLSDMARKSVVASVSDFAAKGVKPTYGIFSITLPRRLGSKINGVARGILEASREFGIEFLGGDTNEGKELILSICLFGPAKKIVKRKGAKRYDSIFVTGPFGYSAAGLEILQKKTKTSLKFSKKSKAAFEKPKPRLKFGIKNAKYFSSSMDSSDGLSTTLHEMSAQSKCRFVINKVPKRQDLTDFAKQNHLDWINLIFHGGEEYEIVFTVSSKNKRKIIKNAKVQKIPLIEIGYVTKGSGVFLQKNAKKTRLQEKGWQHFRS